MNTLVKKMGPCYRQSIFITALGLGGGAALAKEAMKKVLIGTYKGMKDVDPNLGFTEKLKKSLPEATQGMGNQLKAELGVDKLQEALQYAEQFAALEKAPH